MRDPDELTSMQSRVLEYIADFRAANGFPPTRSDISRHFEWRSRNAAEDVLQVLARKGRLRLHRGIARGIELLSA